MFSFLTIGNEKGKTLLADGNKGRAIRQFLTHALILQAVHTATAVRKTKKAIRNAFEHQQQKKGTSFIEVVSNCPSGWKMTPLESNEWMEKNMFPFYPLGDLKLPTAKG